MIHVRVGVGLFKFAERLDAVIGDDKDVGLVIDVFQNAAQNAIEADVFVRKSIGADRIDLGIVSSIVGSNGIKPVSGPIFAGLRQPSEICGCVFNR
jgi:hypothetical protein